MAVIPVRLRKKWFFSSDLTKLLRCIKVALRASRKRPDVIISHVYPTLFKMVALLKRKSSKHIFYYHGSRFQELPQNQLEFFSNHCDGLIAINNYTLRPSEVTEKYFTFPVCRILNAVQIQEIIDEPCEVLPDLGRLVGEKRFLILYAGSLIPVKGVHNLIQAVTELSKIYPQIYLVLAGKKPLPNDSNFDYYRQLVNLSEGKEKNVFFWGWVDHANLVRCYKYFNLSVLLSKEQEGNSLFLMESIVQGTPVLASRLGGIPEVVDEGYTGLLIDDPDDINDIKLKISKMIEDKVFYLQLRKNCLKIGRERFSYHRAAKELDQFISQVVAGN